MKAKNALADLQRKNPRYKEQAYLFVLSALHRRLSGLPLPRHVSGHEVANAIREMALERFGPLARTILEHWGVDSTSDMGEIVFALALHSSPYQLLCCLGGRIINDQRDGNINGPKHG